jgi:hypothetical protein
VIASDLLLPFGERIADGRMVAPEEVANGLACGCVCAKCRRRLVARQGAIVRPHFAHEADAECIGAFESSMHAMAKEIISDARMVRLPMVKVWSYAWPGYDGPGEYTDATFDRISLEVTMPGMRPDIIGYGEDGERMLIEIAVTHLCDQVKADLIRACAIPAMEIDLADYLRDLDPEALRAAVLFEAPRKWLWHSEVDRLIAEAEERRRQNEERYRFERQLAADRALDAARAMYLKERAAFEREAILALGPAAAIRWATEDRFVSILLRPTINVGAYVYDWRNALQTEVERIIREDKRKAAESEIAADLKAHLSRAAVQHFKSSERGELWLRSANPKLGRKRPMDFCVDVGTYRECIDALGRSR